MSTTAPALPRTRTATQLFVKELLRRWSTTAFMVAMPTGYFLLMYAIGGSGTIALELYLPSGTTTVTTLDRDAKSVYNAVLGTGVSSAFAALITLRGSSEAMRRLRLAGFRAAELLAARLAVLVLITVLSAAVFALLLAALVDTGRPVGVFAAMASIGLLGVALGSLLGALPVREFEATMAIVALCGMQLAVGRSEDGRDVERYLPFTPGTDAVKAAAFADSAPIGQALAQGLGYALALLAVTYLIWAVRTRVHTPHTGKETSL